MGLGSVSWVRVGYRSLVDSYSSEPECGGHGEDHRHGEGEPKEIVEGLPHAVPSLSAEGRKRESQADPRRSCSAAL